MKNSSISRDICLFYYFTKHWTANRTNLLIMITDFFIKVEKSLQTRRVLFFFLSTIRILIISTFLFDNALISKRLLPELITRECKHTKNQRFTFLSFFSFYLHQITFVPYSSLGSLFAFFFILFLFSYSIGQTDRVRVYVIVSPHSNIEVLYK